MCSKCPGQSAPLYAASACFSNLGNDPALFCGSVLCLDAWEPQPYRNGRLTHTLPDPDALLAVWPSLFEETLFYPRPSFGECLQYIYFEPYCLEKESSLDQRNPLKKGSFPPRNVICTGPLIEFSLFQDQRARTWNAGWQAADTKIPMRWGSFECCCLHMSVVVPKGPVHRLFFVGSFSKCFGEFAFNFGVEFFLQRSSWRRGTDPAR